MRRSAPSNRNASSSARHDTPALAAERAERIERAEVSREIVPPTLWRLFVLIWLLFLYYPLVNLWLAHPAPLLAVMTVTGTALFAALYLYLALPLPFGEAAPSHISPRTHFMPLVLAVLLAADILLLTLLASVDWLWFFIFVSIALGVRLPPRPAAIAIAATTALTIIVGMGVFDWVFALRVALPVAVVGFSMIGVGWLVATIRALRAAREEIARLAVAEERLRFARDLHDLLGHSLSAITLKNEVARSLIPTHPDRAVHELADAIGLAREALREVRQAVSGYRRATLAAEIRSACGLLDAAGIVHRVDMAADVASLPPSLEAVLAWTVREGVTNVVRYSGARHCTMTVLRQADSIALEVTDDGRGAAAPDSHHVSSGISQSRGGTGLRGLAERAAQVGGLMEAVPREPSGFRLRVTVPLPAPISASSDEGTTHSSEQKATQS